MSDKLTGNGGSITDNNSSAFIGDWEITIYTGLYGFSSWKGRALLKKESRLVGSADGIFEMKGKTYHGNVTVNHNARNWCRCAVEDRAVVTFRGHGALFEAKA
jgi:hypothetical protein